ncbi:MAG: phosphodiester glycosidase family protein [Ruminococcaceae bacterium]|nr:phosphodiester glycosidase family protein [Oscillospiraceae bacterium]
MKRIFAIALAFALLCSLCLTVAAEPHVAENGLKCDHYKVNGVVSGVNAQVNVLEFNPADGLIPFAYTGNSGSVCLAKDHVADAQAKGYEVVGAINGSFFDMSSGAPCGTLISDGKLVFTHNERGESIAAFDKDGKLSVVTSKIIMGLSLNGQSYDGGIGLVNKLFGATSMSKRDITGHFQYYDIDAGDLADTSVTGIEIICEITDGGQLAVGKTLKATVTEIKTDSTYGATKVTDETQFVLFVKTDGLYFKRASVMKAGDKIEITPKESIPAAESVMKNAVSAISSAYYLVKDGVDLTDTSTTIIHDTSLARAWTAFGVKEDGSYVYWVSEEYGLTLKDVADEMVKLGCKNVIRLDGGGSTSMYVDGEDFVMNSTRQVCDVLLVVKKDSIKYEEPTTAPESSAPVESSEAESSEAESSSVSSVESSEEVSEESSKASASSDETEGGNGGMVWIIIGIVLIIGGLTLYRIGAKKK